MPKPLVGERQQSNVSSRLELHSSAPLTKLTPFELDRRLRVKRSETYMKAVTALDLGDVAMNKAALDSLLEAVRQEFPEIPLDCLPVGIVAKCYLGHPYEVHTLDMTGLIIKHYKDNEPLPVLMQRARSLAMHGSYEFIEVYADSLRAVKSDGAVSVVKE